MPLIRLGSILTTPGLCLRPWLMPLVGMSVGLVSPVSDAAPRPRYVRLELLEGVSAWCAGDRAAAEKSLTSARAKWAQLQMSDQALASLAGMGFRTGEVRVSTKIESLG